MKIFLNKIIKGSKYLSTTLSLSGGEDYELLFTISQAHYDKFKKDADFTIVGYVTDASEGNNFIATDGTSHPLTAQGWDGMKKKSG